ncbi:hypothetical protein TruAng_005321 [Truncatella angustata]|nr:hypothetical protein TruAng_005321 [Truncatella angustata]
MVLNIEYPIHLRESQLAVNLHIPTAICSFVPRTLFQCIIDDETASEEVKREAQQQIDAITETLTANSDANNVESKFKTRHIVQNLKGPSLRTRPGRQRLHGLQLEANIHYSIRYRNAIWEPQSQQIVFGDDDSHSRLGRHPEFFKPGSMINSLDVIAYELTHGVTQHTAKSEYRGQPGALNEPVSDVFGSMVLQWEQGQAVHLAI